MYQLVLFFSLIEVPSYVNSFGGYLWTLNWRYQMQMGHLR